MSKKDEDLDPIAQGRKVQAAAVAAQEEKDKLAPTPTQEENDRAKVGLTEEKQAAAEKAGTYKTRDAKPD
jgi:phage-related baseplate assembly protein